MGAGAALIFGSAANACTAITADSLTSESSSDQPAMLVPSRHRETLVDSPSCVSAGREAIVPSEAIVPRET